MARFRSHLPKRFTIVPALLIACLTAVTSWQMLGWDYVDWPQISATSRTVQAAVGPIAATAAALISSHFSKPRSLLALPTAARTDTQLVVDHLKGIVPLWLSALAVGLAPIFIHAWYSATGGQPEVLTVVAGFFVFCAFIISGYAVGVTFPFTYTPLLVLAVSAVAVIARDYVVGGSMAALPVPHALAAVGERETVEFSLTRMVLFGALGIAFAGSALATLRYRRSWSSTVQPFSLGCLVVGLAVLVLGAEMIAPPPVTADPSATPVCAAVAGVEVCVHPAQRPVLSELTAASLSLFEKVGGPPTWLDRVEDQSVDIEDGRSVGVIKVELSPSIVLNSGPTAEIASWLSGRHSCRWDESAMRLVDEEDYYVAEGITAWLLGTSESNLVEGVAVVAEQLRDSGDSASARWYRRHESAIRDCTAGGAFEELS